MAKPQDRREFLKRGATAVGGAAVGAGLGRERSRRPRARCRRTRDAGGDADAQPGSHRLLRRHLQPRRAGRGRAAEQRGGGGRRSWRGRSTSGVNYIDTAARYGGDTPWSERYIGQVMKRRRGEVFLASKTHDRTRDGSLKLLEQSLELLQTDHLDLWQIHNLQTMEEVEQIFAARRRGRSAASRRASRAWCASSASRATPTRPCSWRRSAASRSTPSCWRSTRPTRTT